MRPNRTHMCASCSRAHAERRIYMLCSPFRVSLFLSISCRCQHRKNNNITKNRFLSIKQSALIKSSTGLLCLGVFVVCCALIDQTSNINTTATVIQARNGIFSFFFVCLYLCLYHLNDVSIKIQATHAVFHTHHDSEYNM